MMLKIQLNITGINYILKYIKIFMKTVILKCNNIAQYYCFSCDFQHINVALMSMRDLLQKRKKKQPKLLNGIVHKKKNQNQKLFVEDIGSI